jgi:hypothetical protein
MILFEAILELFESLTTPNTTSCTSDPSTVSDLLDCAKAHEKIEKGEGKKVTLFVTYAEHINELTNRKTVAGQVRVPLFDKIVACVTSNNSDKD